MLQYNGRCPTNECFIKTGRTCLLTPSICCYFSLDVMKVHARVIKSTVNGREGKKQISRAAKRNKQDTTLL